MAIVINVSRTGYAPEQCYSTMTVGELIEVLSQYNPDEPIYTAQDNKYTFGEIRRTRIEEYFTEDEEEEEDDE